MRLKTFSAPTTAEAMDLVRRDLGEDAIIVSTQPGGDGQSARVTAAMEDLDPIDAALPWREDIEEPAADATAEVRQALAFHGTPALLSDRLTAAAGAFAESGALMALAGAFDTEFDFAPVSDATALRRLILVGPPGAGKTISTAKLAARAAAVITSDTRRAGGVEQLGAFTRLLGVELIEADGPAGLADAIGSVENGANVFIDTAGANPFSDTEMETLAALIQSADAEPVLVLAAGGDAQEGADMVSAFAELGANRLLATRLDVARRFGGLLAAADAPRLAFSDVSVTPHIADGLSPINPVSLARLIMPHAEEPAATVQLNEAAL